MSRTPTNLSEDFRARRTRAQRLADPITRTAAPEDVLSRRALAWMLVLLAIGGAFIVVTRADAPHLAPLAHTAR